MKILLINYEYPPYGGGAGTATKYIATELARMGHQVSVLTGGNERLAETGNELSIVDIIRVGSFRKRRDRSNVFEMMSFCLKACLVVTRKEYQTFSVSISFFVLPTGAVSWMLRRRWGVPYVISLRGGDVPGCEANLVALHRVLRPLRRAIYRDSKAVTANSEELARIARDADNVEVSVVPNGVDTRFFSPAHKFQQSTDREIVRFLFVGRFQRQKMVPELVRNSAHARRVHDLNFHLTLMGDGPERRKVESVIRAVEGESWIEWLGWTTRKEVREAYWRSDCLLNLSNYEGMPNTVLEAMACGLAVVASDIGPHRDLVDEPTTGYLVPLFERGLFDEMLAGLSKDRRKVCDMGAQARKKILTHYSWIDVAQSYVSLLEK